MKTWIVNLTVSPPFERAHQWGMYLRLELNDSSGSHARLWSRRFQGMDWMQEPPLSELRIGNPILLSDQLSQSILETLAQAKLQFAPLEKVASIHPTSYQLQIESGSHSCQFNWFDALPREWYDLSELVRILEALGREHSVQNPE
ncbi:hypothetical protein GTP41_21810 [Pseudoduganella sp. DS3]|uniref:Uncharacterized protein n=1 Tax=Pseudoduganella guangdongensis TaxID=2692179 RepID=A0A6N9HME8_9BURK|nr:hypothetical protein [Pseudoduganella guangdongensis]MYN04734.1 hypothetical protein [Pseudoduganella guangdongensis]